MTISPDKLSLYPSRSFPKLSIIIPSYNQGEYIEETLLSILNQNYPNLELIVIDGGSIDNSVQLLKKYENQIDYWISEKDKGQSHAINKGLKRATGEWIAWINSDDCYLEGALRYIFSSLPFESYDFIYGNCLIGSEVSSSIEYKFPLKNRDDLCDLLKFFYSVRHIIPSQSVFIKKKLIDRVGLLNEDLHYCMDLEWYCRIFVSNGRRLFYKRSICFFRINPTTKTSTGYALMQAEAISIVYCYLSHLSPNQRKKLLNLLYLHRVLNKAFRSEEKRHLFFLRIICRVPKQAIMNRRFIGLFLRTILRINQSVKL